MSKELSGGDKITARWMRQNFFTFKPSHTLILVSNHKPRVSGTDHGLWRRLKLIPFTQRFWNEDAGENGPIELRADKQLKDKLRGELDGILSWMVRGCIDWQQHGLGEPVAVVAATNDYRAAEDILAVFIADCCELGKHAPSVLRSCESATPSGALRTVRNQSAVAGCQTTSWRWESPKDIAVEQFTTEFNHVS